MPLWMLPADEPLKPYSEVRERYEHRVDRDFSEERQDNGTDLLSRWRIGAKLSFGKGLQGEVQYQYAHGVACTSQRNFSTENSDLSLAYVDAPVNGGTLTVGRQKIALGDQRLIGPLEWANVSRSFDGVRFKTKQLDLWASNISVAAPRPRDLRLAAAGYKSRWGETNLIFKHDKPAAGDTDIWTLDHLVRRPWRGVNFEFEGALQGGESAGTDHEAWAVHVAASKKLKPNIGIFAEANAASGGSRTDKSRTFDNLYPTNHNKYGTADLQGWRNMTEVVVGANWQPRKDVSAHISWHRFWLRDPADAWYGAGGAPNRGRFGVFRDPSGMSGTDVGHEFDVDVVWNASPTSSLSAGLAVFQPGQFIKGVNGGSATGQIWGYLAFQGRF